MNAHPAFKTDQKAEIISRVDPIDLDELPEPEVYGIAYPKALLPLGLTDGSVSMHGTWEADYILDIDGNEQDVPYVRVWLYGPTAGSREETDE